jgi:parvulin-like peptidyl-prolyl isomerase
MHGMPHLRWAVLGLALSGLTAVAQTPQPAPTPAPASPAAAPVTPTPKVSPTVVAVTVNGEAIYEMAVQRALERVQPARRAEARVALINEWAGNLLIDQSLRNAGYKVQESEVDSRINEMKAEMKKVNRDFNKMLIEYRTTEAELRQHMTADLRWMKYANAQVNDKALRDLFDKNLDMFDSTTVKAWHILITAPATDEKAGAVAREQLKKIKAAIESEVAAGLAKLPKDSSQMAREKVRSNLVTEAFSRYARDKSDCPTKARGGWIGEFQKIGYLTPPLAEAAFALKPFEVSDVVKTPFGYHLIMISERKPGKNVKFEDVKEVVKEVFLEKLHDRLAAQLRPSARIVINPPPK